MYQNEKQKYEIKADYVVVKLFKFAEQSCNMYEQLYLC